MSTISADWIESTGGPLVVIPHSMVSGWKGIMADDYRDACAVDDYLGIIARKWGQVLVLDDEPLRTTVIVRSDGPAIVRWMYAPNEDQLMSVALRSDLRRLRAVEILDFHVLDEPYVIFDSAADGSTAYKLNIKPPAGPRTISTYVIKDGVNEVGLLLHAID